MPVERFGLRRRLTAVGTPAAWRSRPGGTLQRRRTQIFNGTFGAGHGGELRVAATDTIAITGQDQAGFRAGLFSQAEANSSGNAGSVEVRPGGSRSAAAV